MRLIILFLVIGFYNQLVFAQTQCVEYLQKNSLDLSASEVNEKNYILLSNEVLEEVEGFLHLEHLETLKAKHSTQIRLQKNSQGQSLYTAKVAILIHGLFLSPRQMELQAAEAFKQGYNVISLRLKGHNEKSAEALDQVVAEDWLDQVYEVYGLAKNLGDKITLIGHSTGGALALHLAIHQSKYIDK